MYKLARSKVQGARCRVECKGCRVQGARYRGTGEGCTLSGWLWAPWQPGALGSHSFTVVSQLPVTTSPHSAGGGCGGGGPLVVVVVVDH